MVLIWENLCHIVGWGKGQNTLKNLGKMELIVLHLGKDREYIFTKSWVDLDGH
jgi:hypothetical protein